MVNIFYQRAFERVFKATEIHFQLNHDGVTVEVKVINENKYFSLKPIKPESLMSDRNVPTKNLRQKIL